MGLLKSEDKLEVYMASWACMISRVPSPDPTLILLNWTSSACCVWRLGCMWPNTRRCEIWLFSITSRFLFANSMTPVLYVAQGFVNRFGSLPRSLPNLPPCTWNPEISNPWINSFYWSPEKEPHLQMAPDCLCRWDYLSTSSLWPGNSGMEID